MQFPQRSLCLLKQFGYVNHSLKKIPSLVAEDSCGIVKERACVDLTLALEVIRCAKLEVIDEDEIIMAEMEDEQAEGEQIEDKSTEDELEDDRVKETVSRVTKFTA
jgi:hypothetical protein